MGKIAEYLRSHIEGEISDASDVRDNFSEDGGLLKIVPQAVLYPFNEQDVRKVARFAWQLAEKGKKISITSRGLGSDWSSGAIGDGITIVFPTHMNKIIELDSRKGEMLIEPGATTGKVNQALITHGLFLPIDPLSSEFSTVGGAVATNASGLRSAKYGTASENVSGLRVVLSSGEVIETKRISKRELKKKMGLTNFEGELYRGIDTLLNDNSEVIGAYGGRGDATPVNIFDIQGKDGSVDLTPLFIGSQGTLGVITQVKLKVTAFNPAFKSVVCGFYDIEQFNSVASGIAKLKPSVYTVISKATLELFAKLYPLYVGEHFGDKLPELLVLLEWDEFSVRSQKKSVKKLQRLCSKLEVTIHTATTEKAKEQLSRLYRIPAILLQSEIDTCRPVPGVESSLVELDKYFALDSEIDAMSQSLNVKMVSWYDASLGIHWLFPFLDLRQLGQRQKLSKLIELHAELLKNHNALAGIKGGGRIAADSFKATYGDVLYDLFVKVKQLFDPYNILNPGVKFNTDKKAVQAKMTHGYSLGHKHSHLPK